VSAAGATAADRVAGARLGYVHSRRVRRAARLVAEALLAWSERARPQPDAHEVQLLRQAEALRERHRLSAASHLVGRF
jgi:hypothetical protein